MSVEVNSVLRRNVTIGASAGLSTVLGSIHAFSVFIPQWENLHGANRANVSFIYSTALVSLTVAVFFGHQAYKRLSPSFLFVVVGVLAALGLALAAGSSSLILLYLTYGLLFGGANGLGYGYALQLSGQAAPDHRGLAMGLVTAFYAVGATTAPLLFGVLIIQGGNALALAVMSAIVAFIAFVAAVLLKWCGAQYDHEPTSSNHTLSPTLARTRILLWVGYGSAVAAGLMVIGHAYGIAVWMNLNATSATWSATIVAFGNMFGGFSAGYCADRLASRVILRWLPLATSFGLLPLVLPFDGGWIAVFFSLGLIGYCYGAIIAVYPVAVADIFGALAAPRIYGQIFTAWGLAGLMGPWFSGWLFDRTDSYTPALIIAMLLSGVSIVVMRYCASYSYSTTT